MTRPASISMLLAAVICVLFSFAGASRAAASKADDEIVKAGDTLDIRIPSVPLLSKQYVVADNGTLYFPVLEDVNLGWFNLAGPDRQCKCTVGELKQMMEKKLGEFFQPDLTSVEIDPVSLTMRAEYTVYLYGEVPAPGSVRYSDGMKLLDVLIKGGKFSDTADYKHVRINRNGTTMPPVDVSGIVDGSDFSQNVPIQIGDIVVVPAKEVREVKVIAIGKVKTIGSYVMPEGSRVLDLYAKIGGDEGRSGVGNAYIIRNVNNKPTAISVDFKAMVRKLDLTQNKALEDGDVFYIPESKGMDIMRLVNNITVLNYFRTIFTVGN